MSTLTTLTPTSAPVAPALYRAADATQANGRSEIAFVLDNVADWQTLAAGVAPGVDVVVLDSRGDALAQMASYLTQRAPGSVDAIHLLGHGSSGAVNLGAVTLSADTLNTHANTLAAIGAALTADGDWLLYGCHVAAGASGVDFIGKLAQATGADIAASTDLTGNGALGGDWVLEVGSRTIETMAVDVADFASVLATFDLSATTGGVDIGLASRDADANKKIVTQIQGADTIVITATDVPIVVGAETEIFGDVAKLDGQILFAGYDDAGLNNPSESKITIAVAGGKVFNFSSFDLANYVDPAAALKITTNNGSATIAYDGTAKTISLSGAIYQGISYAEITRDDGQKFSWCMDNFVLDIAVPGPTVTDGNISITSSPTGTSSTYKIGDTVTATWDNTVSGDGNTVITGVTMDFSAFGGGAAVAAINSSGNWTASYTLVAGSVDGTNKNVAVTATSSGSTTTADTTNLTVDNQAPTVTDAKISLSGATGTSGAYKIGDTITATWNNTGTGDNNSDISSATVNFSAFGGGTAVAAINSSGTWTASYTIVAGAIDGTNKNVSVTATDNAGNTTTTADSTSATLDNQAPTVTDAKLSISGASGTGGAFKIGDTVTATWDNTAATGEDNADTISSVTVDFSAFGGGAAVAASNSGGIWTATYSLLAGAINGTTSLNVAATATDNAGNTTTTADTTNATVDNVAPAITFSALSFSADTGSSNTDFVTNTAAQSIGATLSAGLGVGDMVYGSLDNGSTWTDITSMVSGTTLTWIGATLSGSTLKLKVTDSAGNDGTVASQAYVLDSATPAAPGTPNLADDSDTGTSSTDDLTNDTTPTFTGTAESGVTVKLFDIDGTTEIGSGTADGSGNWSITASTLSAGAHTLTAKATDLAGNESAASSGLTVTIDTIAPTFDTGPTAASLTTTGFTPTASLNESGTGYFVVVADGAAAPSVAQVMAGQNNAGAAALASGSAAASSGAFDAGFSAVTSLSASTAYDVYFVAIDVEGNPQTNVTKVDVTTASPNAAPSLAVGLDDAFQDADWNGWILPSNTGATSQSMTGEMLQLTPNSGGQFGGALFDKAFASNATMTVEFRYYSGGGSGADGMALFLVDGTTSSFTLGYPGGALGYLPYDPTPGLSGGWLGLGLDEYGYSNGYPSDPIPGIGLHGSESKSYPRIAVKSEADMGGNSIDGGYRQVKVTLTPDNQFTVLWDYNDDGSYDYTAIDLDLDGHPDKVSARPDTLKFGFAAATGGLTNIHAIDWFKLNTSTSSLPTLAYAEGEGSKIIAPYTLFAQDTDNATLSGATIAITDNYQSTQDFLRFTNTAEIAGSFNNTTGTLTLSGSATLAQYQAALRTVAYENTSDTPSTATRGLTFKVNDGTADSNQITGQIVVSAVNDAPTISAGTTTAFTEQTATPVAPAITLSDVDGDAGWNGGTLKVQITGNATTADGLRLPTSSQAGIWVDGIGTAPFNLYDGATQIGTASASGVSAGTAWTFTFNANATNARVQDVARAIRFGNDSNDPDTTSRTVTFTATDAAAAQSSATQTVSVAAVNDVPQVTNRTDPALAFSGEATSYAAFPDVDDAISTAFTLETWVKFSSLTGTYAVQFIAGMAVEQMELHTNGTALRFIPTGGAYIDTGAVLTTDQWIHIAASYDASSDASHIYINGTEVATQDNLGTVDEALKSTASPYKLGQRGDGSYPLNGAIAEYRIWSDIRTADEIRNNMDVSLAGTEDNLVALWKLDEGSDTALADSSINHFNGTANSASWTTRPVSGGLAVNYTEDTSAVGLFSGATVSTVESGQSILSLTFTVTQVSDSNESLGIDGATVNLTQGNSGTTTANSVAYSVSLDSGTATVTLTHAGLTEAQAAALINGITYANSSQNPTTTNPRVVTLTALQDNGGGSSTATLALASTVTVIAANDAPTLTGTPSDVSVTQGTASNFDLSAVTVADVDSNNLTLTLEASAGTFAATISGSVSISGSGSATLTLTGTAANINAWLDTTSNIQYTGAANASGDNAATFTLQVSDGTADSSVANGYIDMAAAAITSATYDAATGVLVVTGTNLKANSGGADIDASALTLTGEGGATYTLTDTADVEQTSATEFTLTLSATDRAAVNQIVNKNGASSTGATTYNLAAADDWNTAVTAGDTSDTTSNGIAASSVAVPTLTSATYNASTGALLLSGTGLLKASGATNDIVVNKLTFTVEGGVTYTLTDTPNAEITSGTAATVTLSATDQAALNQIINKNGTSSTGGTTYNLAAAEDWAAGADAAVVVADTTGNGITASNVPVPQISSATYNAQTGVLVVSGTDFVHMAGDSNDIVANKLAFTGAGNASYSLTDTANVEITSGTAFTLTLSATDKAAVSLLLNKSGSTASDSTVYNLAAAEDWAAGVDAAVVVADLNANGITATVNQMPTITSNLGGDTAAVSVAENTTAVTTVVASDADAGQTLTFSLSGGADQAKFQINIATGVLSFVSAPNFEARADADANNTYVVDVSVSDGNGGSDTQTLTVTVTDVDETPAPPPPEPEPTTPDSDGVSDAVEDAVPSLPLASGGTAVVGDGNGDGLADSQQSSVTSVSFLDTPTAVSDPADAPAVFVSLVADSLAGKTDPDSGNATLRDVQQRDAPVDLPAEINMPLGLISFKADVGISSDTSVGEGVSETFSLYVDARTQADGSFWVNGYWKQNASGTWVNLASEVYGGDMVQEGGKLRLDFVLTDGGEFDADGQVDGVITDPGAAASMPLSLVGYAPDLPAGTPFWF